MNKKNKLMLLFLITIISLTACTNKDKKDEVVKNDSVEVKEENGLRQITDLTGAVVEIPYSKDIKNVVIIAPPLPATFASVVGDTNKIAGMHPKAIDFANEEILDMVITNWRDINTTFIKGFTSNIEELMNLKPDLILVYGDSQKEGLDTIGVPVVDFYQDDSRNEEWSVKIDKLMRDIFEISSDNSLEKEWDEANKIVKPILDSIGDNKKKAIMINSNEGGMIAVRGANYYGDDWLIKTGLINCASETNGDGVQVSMEDIYNWNPDIIYDFGGTNASKYLNNEFEGQDWSKINAIKNKQVYNMPRGMYNWGAPNVDSPLTLIWMTMKNYDDSIDEEFFKDYMFKYYKRQYDLELTEELYNSIIAN